MTFIKQIDIKTRFMVIYQDVSTTPTRISKILKIPLSTIYYWVKKIEADEDIFEIKNGRGPKPKISHQQKKQVMKMVEEKPSTTSVRRAGAKVGVSKSTTHRILKSENIKYTSIQNDYHNHNEDEKIDRVQFCQRMLKRKGEPLSEVFFADEMGIKLKATHNTKAWMKDGNKKLKTEKPTEDVKLNCWASISERGASSLHIYKENLNSELYQDILEQHEDEMNTLYPEGFKFIHDNYKIHKKVENEINFDFVSFPTYSPDLNPIENLWATLKREVAYDAPKNEKQLRESLQRNWKNITSKKQLEPYFEGMKKKYKEVIDNDGEMQ